MPITRRRLAVAAALLAAGACGRADPALGRHVDHPDFPADAAWAFLLDQVAIGPRYAGTKLQLMRFSVTVQTPMP